MKLVRYEIEEHFVFDCQQINVLIVENEKIFQQYAFDFYNAINNGISGRFVLSNDLEIINLNKVMIMISDYFALSVNNKKIANKLLKRFVDSANDDMQVAENYQEICSKIMQLAGKLEDIVDFQITYDGSVSIEDIIKLLNVKFEEKAFDSLLDKLIDFVTIASEFSLCEVIVFVNLKSYLSEDELKELYKSAQYKKVNLFLLENCQKPKIDGEKIVIIDEDKCEILG